MKKHTRIISGLLSSVFMLTVFFSSCENPEDPKEKLAIGIVFPVETARWGEEAPIIKTMLEADGYSCTVRYSNNNVTTEASNIDQFGKDGIDILVYCYVNDSVAAINIATAKAAGMKVICYDRLPTGTAAIDCYVAVDNIKIGEAMGTYLVSKVPAGSTAAPLYLYTGHLDDYNSVLFFRGSWNILQPKIADGTFEVKNSPKANELKNALALTDDQIRAIISETTTSWSTSTAGTLATSNLGSQTGTVYILAPNDTTSRAIYEVFDPQCSPVAITGQDGETASIQAIIDGKQGMTILKKYAMISRTAAKVTAIYAGGNTPSASDLSFFNNGTADIPFYGAELIGIDSVDDIRQAILDGELTATDYTGL